MMPRKREPSTGSPTDSGSNPPGADKEGGADEPLASQLFRQKKRGRGRPAKPDPEALRVKCEQLARLLGVMPWEWAANVSGKPWIALDDDLEQITISCGGMVIEEHYDVLMTWGPAVFLVLAQAAHLSAVTIRLLREKNAGKESPSKEDPLMTPMNEPPAS